MRDKRIDILKAIGIILVVWGHFSSLFARWIYTFHMPLFFFATGFLRYGRKNKTWKTFLTKKLKTVIVPYVVFWTISVVIFNNLSYLIKFKQFFPIGLNEFKGLLLGGEWLNSYSNNFGLWFLQTYFIASIVFEIIVRNFNSKIKVFAFVFFTLATVPFQSFLTGRPIFHINVLPAALSFMFIGYFVKYAMSQGRLKSLQDNILIGGFSIIIGWILSVLNHYGNISDIKSPLYIISATLTILGIYILSDRLTNSKILNYIGSATIYILGLHCITFPVIQKLLSNIGLNNTYLVIIATVALSVFMCCAMVEIYTIIKGHLSIYIKRLAKS